MFELNILPIEWFLFFAAWVGASLTSFGRLAVWRLPHQLGWREDPEKGITVCSPPSRCDTCGSRIPLLYLIPVFGWFLSRGRCYSCGVKVPLSHPLIEFFGGLGWIVALLYFGNTEKGLAACLLWQVLLFLAEIDWRESWLPAVVTYPLFWAGLLLSPFEASDFSRAVGAFCGFFAMWISIFLVSHWKKNDFFAGGDIALATAAGAWLGMSMVPLFLLIASLLFVIMALPARRRNQLMVPMGPALAVSFILCLFLNPSGWEF